MVVLAIIVVVFIVSQPRTSVLLVNDYCSDVHNLLTNAKKEVRVAMFMMTTDREGKCPTNLIIDLAELKKRGIDVKVYLDANVKDYHSEYFNAYAERFLRENNIPVCKPKRRLHAKVVKVDNCYVIGSHNWTYSAMRKNIEYSVIVCNAPSLDRIFHELEEEC